MGDSHAHRDGAMSYLVLQSAISGILLGFVYALVAIGLTMVFGVMGVANFAHGAFLMLGMYFTYWIFMLLGIDPYLGAIGSFSLLFFMGILIQRFLISPMLKAHHHMQVILTFGILVLLENLVLVLWGPELRSVTPAYSLSVIELGALCLSVPRLLASGLAVGMTAVLYWLLRRTDLGLAIQATAQDEAGATLMGIDVPRIQAIVFGLGSACAGFAGALLTPFFYLAPDVGNVFLMTAFVVVVLGGMGSFEGALLGGLIIGIVESMAGALLGPSLKGIVIYAIFFVLLLSKPRGLLGRESS